MKPGITALLWALLSVCLPAAAQRSESLPIDPKTSTLTWTGHAEIGSYAPQGTLAVRDGSILIENGAVRAASLTVDMKSLSQSNADLTHHLKSSDFFDVDTYPTAVLKIDRVGDGKVFGTMTIKGKSAPIEAPVAVKAMDGRFLIHGTVTLDRTQYGVVYNSSNFFANLGNKAIRNSFEVEFALQGQGELPRQYRQ